MQNSNDATSWKKGKIGNFKKAKRLKRVDFRQKSKKSKIEKMRFFPELL